MVFVWVVVVEIDSFFLCGRKLLGFSVNIEIGLFFVWVVDTDLISVRGVELELVSVWGSELIWFVSWG